MTASPVVSPPTWVVHPVIRSNEQPLRSHAGRLSEACTLAASVGLNVTRTEQIRIRNPKPGTLLGGGALDHLNAERNRASEPPQLFLFNVDLSPVQQRNLETTLQTKVLDRTALILEIFGARAATREGRLQVELAHLEWQRSRLVRSWTHLERQRGGFGFLGGPGESQIEIDRRLNTKRCSLIRRELETVRQRRAIHRRHRHYPTVALVGYANAGKSTLFSRLTGKSADASDRPFTTLDPLMRARILPSGQRAIFSDTVGFVSELPTHLIAAFRATLEEAVHADLLIHVRDITHPETAAQRRDVFEVLTALGAVPDEGTDVLEVLNKVDQLTSDEVQRLRREQPHAVAISALEGSGVAEMLEAVDRHFGQHRTELDVVLSPTQTTTLAWLYKIGAVIDQRTEADSLHLRVKLDGADLGRLNARLAAEDACGRPDARI